MKMLILVLSLMSGAAAAQTVGLHIGSAHAHGGLNPVNPGLYVRGENWTAGTYYNSERRQSFYAGYTIETSGRISFALTAGAVTGYHSRPVMPLLVPSVAVHFGNEAVRIGIIPRPPVTGASAALHLMVERHF